MAETFWRVVCRKSPYFYVGAPIFDRESADKSAAARGEGHSVEECYIVTARAGAVLADIWRENECGEEKCETDRLAAARLVLSGQPGGQRTHRKYADKVLADAAPVAVAREAFLEAALAWIKMDRAAKKPPYPAYGQHDWDMVWRPMSEAYDALLAALASRDAGKGG